MPPTRIGRDVLEVGLLKRTFEEYDVRFIAAGDNLDTANGFGTVEILIYIRKNGGEVVIPPKSNTKKPWNCDFYRYKERHLVECFFNKLKHFRCIATRYSKLSSMFQSFTYLAAIMVWLK